VLHAWEPGTAVKHYCNSAGTRNGMSNFFSGVARGLLSTSSVSAHFPPSIVDRTCLHDLVCVRSLYIGDPDAVEPCGVEWVPTVHRTCLHDLVCVRSLYIGAPDAVEPCGVEWVP
jgi:hypothetical protein